MQKEFRDRSVPTREFYTLSKPPDFVFKLVGSQHALSPRVVEGAREIAGAHASTRSCAVKGLFSNECGEQHREQIDSSAGLVEPGHGQDERSAFYCFHLLIITSENFNIIEIKSARRYRLALPLYAFRTLFRCFLKQKNLQDLLFSL